MPYRDKSGRICGFLDVETKENHFSRRYFIVNSETEKFECYMDNPINLPDGSKPISCINLNHISIVQDATRARPKVLFCFVVNSPGKKVYFKADDEEDKHYWVQALNNAVKIKAPVSKKEETAAAGSPKPGSGYRAEVVAGVVLKTQIEACSSTDSSDNDDAPFGSIRPFPILKAGYCVKQGFRRKNWLERYFILNEESLSYFKNDKKKVPIKSLPISSIKDVRRSIGVHPSRENVIEIVTTTRVFYIQSHSFKERESWIHVLNSVLNKDESDASRLATTQAPSSRSTPPPQQVHLTPQSADVDEMTVTQSMWL